MIVVSDSSPLVSLAAIEQLSILRRLFGHVIIPEAVAREIMQQGAGKTGATEVAKAAWIEHVAVEETQLVSLLKTDLDLGEAEAIALGLERGADVILMDERAGRRRARALGLQVAGVVGILVEAKKKGYLAEVKPILEALLSRAGFYLGESVYRHALQMAGELPDAR